MTKTRIISAVILVGLLLAAVGIYYFSGYSRIKCWTQEIDINSGRTRYTHYLFWKVTEQEISPTWMSQLLNKADEEIVPNWHLVAALSPGTPHSPHFAFHSAIADIDTAKKVFDLYDIPRDRQVALAEEIRSSWNRTGNDAEAHGLITQLFDEAVAGKYPKRQF
ncbi:MAG: hypothetical protein ACYS8Z_10125 [Planctomycetota bacterium]|jgi:hypothetical protein